MSVKREIQSFVQKMWVETGNNESYCINLYCIHNMCIVNNEPLPLHFDLGTNSMTMEQRQKCS